MDVENSKDNDFFDDRDEFQKRSIGAKCGHVKFRLSQNESLYGKVLKFALDVIEESRQGFSDGEFLDNLREKLSNGEELSDYEQHIMVDVLLEHKKIFG